MCTITKNENFNSFELTFDGMPSEQIRNLLKANGYRWNSKRGVWYGYKDISTLLNGEQTASANVEQKSKKTLAPLWERTRTDNLPKYGTTNDLKKAARESGECYDKAAAAIIRKHLRERFPEVKFSVTSGGAGWLMNVDIQIKSSPYALNFIKGDPNAYDHRDRYDHTENSDELAAVLAYCRALHSAFDSDDGDHYADYGAHHELYGDASLYYKYEQTEPTTKQIADCADFAEKKINAEKAEQERRDREFEEQQKQAEIDRQNAEEQRKRDEQTAAEIMQNITVEDLPKAEQIAITALIGGIGKECNIDELRETIADGHATHTDAVITRKITFTSAALCAAFCNMFLEDWEFLQGMGGSATEDTRINSMNDYNKLTKEQRNSVKWYACNCVAVYLGDALQLVIDPQGFDYARYVYVWDCGRSDKISATAYKSALCEESKAAQPFYTPASLAEQIKDAQIKEGETFTALRVNGWIVTTQRITGKIISATPTEYAQYKDAARIEYTPTGKRKPHYFITHTGEDFVLYRGILPTIPESMKYTTIHEGAGAIMQSVNFAGQGADDFIKKAIAYYKELGYSPIINLIPA